MATFREHIAHILSKGIATTNRFEVIIPLPVVVLDKLKELRGEKKPSFLDELIFDLPLPLGIAATMLMPKSKELSESQSLSIMVDEIPIPGRTLPTTEIRYNSDVYKIPYGVLYENQNIVFGCTADMFEKFIIDLWMSCIFDPDKHEMEYMDNYATDITVNFLDKSDRVINSVVWEKAFPINVDVIQLSQQASEQAKITTTFAFRRWRSSLEPNDVGLIDSLSQTPLGPFITPILSNPIVQGALDALEDFTGIDLEGEGVAIYNQIDSILKGATGTSINKLGSILNGILSDIESNTNLSTSDQQNLVDLVQKLLGKLKG